MESDEWIRYCEVCREIITNQCAWKWDDWGLGIVDLQCLQQFAASSFFTMRRLWQKRWKVVVFADENGQFSLTHSSLLLKIAAPLFVATSYSPLCCIRVLGIVWKCVKICLRLVTDFLPPRKCSSRAVFTDSVSPFWPCQHEHGTSTKSSNLIDIFNIIPLLNQIKVKIIPSTIELLKRKSIPWCKCKCSMHL